MPARIAVLLLLLLSLPISTVSICRAYPVQSNKVQEELRSKLSHRTTDAILYLGCRKIHATSELLKFYSQRDYRPVWVDEQGVNKLGRQLPDYIRDLKKHGLDPEDYHLYCLEENLQNIFFIQSFNLYLDYSQLAELEIILSDAFMVCASHLSNGRVDPVKFNPLWMASGQKIDIQNVLSELSSFNNLEEAFARFIPSCRQYQSLLDAGKMLEQIIKRGGWPQIPEGPSLNLGDTDDRVSFIRKRLAYSGDLDKVQYGPQNLYNSAIELAVKRFQARHGLKVDGVLGVKTRKEMNIPAEMRWKQTMINLERIRWLPCHWGIRYVLVNAADFLLSGVDQGQEEVSMKVIVGKKYHKTPVFSDKMQYMVINPYWNVPRSISVKELLPQIKEDVSYLQDNHYEILTGWEESSSTVDPQTIDWSKINEYNFPFRIRQKPGPWNSLGHIKFMFPNRFNVYLHDTPHKHLFEPPERAFSHGCIRVERPINLALFLLQDDPSWDRKRIERAIASRDRKIVNIASECKVHLIYATAWVREGKVYFHNDIYDRDTVLLKALNLKSPSSVLFASN